MSSGAKSEHFAASRTKPRLRNVASSALGPLPLACRYMRGRREGRQSPCAELPLEPRSLLRFIALQLPTTLANTESSSTKAGQDSAHVVRVGGAQLERYHNRILQVVGHAAVGTI